MPSASADGRRREQAESFEDHLGLHATRPATRVGLFQDAAAIEPEHAGDRFIPPRRPRPERLEHGSVLVGQDLEGKSSGHDQRGVRGRIVGRQPNHLGAQLLERCGVLGEPREFGAADAAMGALHDDDRQGRAVRDLRQRRPRAVGGDQLVARGVRRVRDDALRDRSLSGCRPDGGCRDGEQAGGEGTQDQGTHRHLRKAA